jgi:HEAT repeat protein
MYKLIIILLAASLSFQGCSMVKSLFKKDKKKTDVNMAEVENLRREYQDGQVQALQEIISMYNDSNLPFDVRIAAGNVLAQTQHPTALNAIAKVVSEAEALDLSFMEASIELLAEFRENPAAGDAMVNAMHTIDEKSNQLHMTLIKNLNRVRSKDQVLALLELYETSKANVSRTNKLLTETLGAIGSNEVIPILVTISKDPEINIAVRNRALEILGKKDPQEVAPAFAELLGDPEMNTEIREFAINTMAGVKEENLILALIETYNVGKKQYFSMLNTLLDALGEFDDPQVYKATIDIATNNEFPVHIRAKAIRSLGRFADDATVVKVLPVLEDADNYPLREAIIDMLQTMGRTDQYAEELRRMAFKAQQKAMGQ